MSLAELRDRQCHRAGTASQEPTGSGSDGSLVPPVRADQRFRVHSLRLLRERLRYVTRPHDRSSDSRWEMLGEILSDENKNRHDGRILAHNAFGGHRVDVV